MSFEGEIGEFDLIERLVELGKEQFTGAIRFESDGIIKIVYFKGGDVLSASTNDRTDAIDEILLRANKVTREHVKQALAKRKESETLGDALLGLGFITRKELTWARRVQVIGVLRSIIGWTTGSYTIVEDYLPKREEGTLFPLPQIIVELVVTDNDRTKSEQAMNSGNAVFAKGLQFDDAFRRLGLNEDAEQIVAQIDGSRSAAEVASRSGKDIFNVYKLLEALRLLRLVARVDKPPVELEVYPPSPRAENFEVENPDFTLEDVAPTAPAIPADEWASAEGATLAIPAAQADAWATADAESKAAPPRSVWDEPAVADPAIADPALTREIAPPPPGGVVKSRLPSEPQWGFDEAQIEAARRASVPVRGKGDVPTSIAPAEKPPKPPSRAGLWVLIIIVLLAAAAAYPAWQWWQSRNKLQPVVVQRPSPQPRRSAAVPPAGPAASLPPAVIATTTSAKTAIPNAAATSAPPPVPRPVATATVAQHVEPTSTATPRLERTTTGVSISNGPTASSASTANSANSDAMRAKYDGMARGFASQKGGHYTIQFELVCETASITRALSESGEKVWFLSTTYHGRSCYRVFWGRYETSAEALAAAKQMPAGMGAVPVVVKIPR